MEFYFKKTLFGMVLMVKDRKPGNWPGEWKYFWRRASQLEASNFTTETGIAKKEVESYREFKDKFPQYFI